MLTRTRLSAIGVYTPGDLVRGIGKFMAIPLLFAGVLCAAVPFVNGAVESAERDPIDLPIDPGEGEARESLIELAFEAATRARAAADKASEICEDAVAACDAAHEAESAASQAASFALATEAASTVVEAAQAALLAVEAADAAVAFAAEAELMAADDSPMELPHTGDGIQRSYAVPLLTSADSVWRGLVRIINRSDRSGTVQILGTDEKGNRFGPVNLSIGDGAARHLTSHDVEFGNDSKGLIGALGNGEGNWRLQLQTDLIIEVGAYILASDGFLTPVHDLVRTAKVGDGIIHQVPIFNPGGVENRVSLLRLTNITGRTVQVTVRGRDDEGHPALGGDVRLSLSPGESRTLSAEELEAGAIDLSGRLGDGAGKWQLFVTADGLIEVMSLVQAPSGHLTNLSTSGLRRGRESRLPGSILRDCAECPELIVVPAGSYMMGSSTDEMDRDDDEGPVHLVRIGEPFAVGRDEVTFSQWDACHEAGGCLHDPDDQGWGRGDRPVVDVSWNDAQQYVRWLSEKTGRQYALLSEAQWEYVARAGTTTRFWSGDGIGSNHANCDGCGSRWDGRRTAPVGSFPSNAFGLFDVHGNVWEWIDDCRNASYEGAPDDGTVYDSGQCELRGLRGGGWDVSPVYLRSANRGANGVDSRLFFDNASAGLRVARELQTERSHTLSFFRAAGHAQIGFARITNHSDRAGTVRIYGIDDNGQKYGPITLPLNSRESRHINSRDLESGNAAIGLFRGLGDGAGDWRLELVSDLDLEPSTYVVSSNGFVAPTHGIVRATKVGDHALHLVPFFGAADAESRMNWLRLVNVSTGSVDVSITGLDDSGRPAPEGIVELILPAGAARTLSAHELEHGGPGIDGRLGKGNGNWRLSLAADGDIEAIVLHQGATSTLSNLSTTLGPADTDFVIYSDSPAVVRPLQAILLTASDALFQTDYTVVMDLSGRGSFGEEHTIEVAAVTNDKDQLLLAAPMTQALPASNLTHQFAFRVRRDADQRLSNTLHFFIEDYAIPRALSGHPSTALEIMLLNLYSSSDDPLLELDSASINPGLLAASANILDLDAAVPDVQAEAILSLLFDQSLAEWVEQSRSQSSLSKSATASSNNVSPQSTSNVALMPHANAPGKEGRVSEGLRKAFGILADCVSNNLSERIAGGGRPDDTECFALTFDVAEAVNAVMDKIGTIFRWSGKLMPRSMYGSLGQRLSDEAQVRKRFIQWSRIQFMAEHRHSIDDSQARISRRIRDYAFDELGVPKLLQRGLSRLDESLRSGSDELKHLLPSLIGETVREYGSKGRTEEQREALSAIVNEADNLQKEADKTEAFRNVHVDGMKPLDAIEKRPTLLRRVASGCATGYREFVIDAASSTCVFESLVEENCYAGSRRPSEVDLGDSDACLYYSLDFFQPDGSCRRNYRKIHYNGRQTCRWSGLGEEMPAWYTLNKAIGKKLREADDPKLGENEGLSVKLTRTTIAAPEGLTATGFTLSAVPKPPRDVPPAPDVRGLEPGCHGEKDGQNGRDGRWVCVYSSGTVEFETYRSGTLHGPTGKYDSDGNPSGYFGSYDNGEKEGVWLFFYSSGTVEFETYRSGTLHGPTGKYDSEGNPSGYFGSYDNGDKEGVWLFFYSSGTVEFETYRSGTLHGPSGKYNRGGKRHGYFGSYANGDRSGTWTYYRDGERENGN